MGAAVVVVAAGVATVSSVRTPAAGVVGVGLARDLEYRVHTMNADALHHETYHVAPGLLEKYLQEVRAVPCTNLGASRG